MTHQCFSCDRADKSCPFWPPHGDVSNCSAYKPKPEDTVEEEIRQEDS